MTTKRPYPPRAYEVEARYRGDEDFQIVVRGRASRGGCDLGPDPRHLTHASATRFADDVIRLMPNVEEVRVVRVVPQRPEE